MTQEISPEAFKSAIHELLAIYEGDDALVVTPGEEARLAMIHPLLAHTFEMARAVLMLIDASQVSAAKALSRVAMEHAVFAQWVYQHPEGLLGLSAKEAASYRKLYNGLKEGFVFPDEIAEFYETKMKNPIGIPSDDQPFEQVCLCFEDGKDLYRIYRLVSGSVHPGNLTAREYIEYSGDGSQVTLRWKAVMSDPIPPLHITALSVSLAASIYEDLREGKPRINEIESIATSVGIKVPLVLKPKKSVD